MWPKVVSAMSERMSNTISWEICAPVKMAVDQDLVHKKASLLQRADKNRQKTADCQPNSLLFW